MSVTAGYNSSTQNGVNYITKKATENCSIIANNVAGYNADWIARGYISD